MKPQMQIVIAATSVLMIPTYSEGLTLCAHNNTYIGVLKKTPNGVSIDVDSTEKTWQVTFEHNVVTGLAACNSIDGTRGVAKTNLYTSASDSGTKCWCKMEPVPSYSNNEPGSETGLTSYWVFLTTYVDRSECESSCTQACAESMQRDLTYRSNVYESIW